MKKSSVRVVYQYNKASLNAPCVLPQSVPEDIHSWQHSNPAKPASQSTGPLITCIHGPYWNFKTSSGCLRKSSRG